MAASHHPFGAGERARHATPLAADKPISEGSAETPSTPPVHRPASRTQCAADGLTVRECIESVDDGLVVEDSPRRYPTRAASARATMSQRADRVVRQLQRRKVLAQLPVLLRGALEEVRLAGRLPRVERVGHEDVRARGPAAVLQRVPRPQVVAAGAGVQIVCRPSVSSSAATPPV